MKNQIVIGLGEVGIAVHKVLSKHYKNVSSFDTNRPDKADKYDFINIDASHRFDVMHICFPHMHKFSTIVRLYSKVFRPNLIVIHSSVPIGTTRQLGDCAVHSPVIGNHPHLLEGIETFDKYFGGNNRPIAKRAMALFAKCGIKGKVCKSEESEALKLVLNIGYGLGIVFEKEVFEMCKKKGLNFALVYKLALENYNKGYSKLNMQNVQRSIYEHMEGPIGGHCVIENCHLIKNNLGIIPKLILAKNDKLAKQSPRKKEFSKKSTSSKTSRKTSRT